MFDFFKVLFNKKQEIIKEEIIDSDEEVNIDEKIKEINVVKEKTKQKLINSVKNKTKSSDIIIEEITDQLTKEHKMAEIFLVVIDTTSRQEATGFQKGIQNFYFIFANDEDNAKDIVLTTFSQRPGLRDQLRNATKATRLSSIIRNVHPGSNFWTYLPFGRQRLPGQQAVIPNPEALLGKDQYGNSAAAAYSPQAPIGGEEITPEDLKKVSFSGQDAPIINKFKNKNGNQIVPIPEEAPPTSPTDPVVLELAKQNRELNEKFNKLTELLVTQNTKKPGKKTKATDQE